VQRLPVVLEVALHWLALASWSAMGSFLGTHYPALGLDSFLPYEFAARAIMLICARN
jgi:hypothetical protein